MSHDPFEGIDPELLAWHQGALEGDPAVCGAPQPARPGFPCVWNRNAHPEHRDVFGRTWSAASSAEFAGTVRIDTIDRGLVVVDEPGWCVGHADEAAPYRRDITHRGPQLTTHVLSEGHGRQQLMQARMSHAPYSFRHFEAFPVVGVNVDLQGDFEAEDIPNLAAALRSAATVLEFAAAEAIRLRNEGAL